MGPDGSRLSNAPDNQTVLSTYKYFFLLLLYLGCTSNQGDILFGYLLQLLVL